MLLSIFTPTHRPTYLEETYRSIQRQSYTNWEWVLVPNGNQAHIPDHIRQDPKVRIVDGGIRKKIGALKRHACNACNGSAFIELDHDDLLMPGESLRMIADEIQAGAGFVYSDTALFQPNFAAKHYSESYGWEHYSVDLYGRKLEASRCFDITAKSLSEIYYAPDHVRVWGRKAYEETGGHDQNLLVGDDHDLMIRTYLKGFKFAHTGHCNYLYRLHDSNTVKLKNDEIQQQVAINRRKYTGRLIAEEARRGDYRIVDMAELWQDGWRFERDLKNGFGNSDSVGVIICRDLLQWCERGRIAEFMNQAYNALRPGGYIEIRIPSTDGRAAWQDPAYLSQMNAGSFHTYCRKVLAEANPEIRCRFQFLQAFDEFPSNFHEQQDMKYAVIQLTALKGQRQPGLCHI